MKRSLMLLAYWLMLAGLVSCSDSTPISTFTEVPLMPDRFIQGTAPLPEGVTLPPLPILSPTALTGDGGDGKAYLCWNPQIEDERVVGWWVMGVTRGKNVPVLTKVQGQGDSPLTKPQFVVEGLTNGQSYTFAVVGVLKDGNATPPSNTATVTPRAVGTAKVEPIARDTKITVGGHEVAASQYAFRATFPDGQELVYDFTRPIDWKARDGEHLLYPKVFGNALDICQFDARGLTKIMPAQPVAGAVQAGPVHDPTRPIDPAARYAQSGTSHPTIGDPMTLPLTVYNHDAPMRWLGTAVDGDRVTFHYALPMSVMGYRSWNMVLVWETWWPIERDRRGTAYHGLARLIEVQMPSALKHGYQVMLNNGFGPNGGSREGVVSYSSGFRKPGSEIVDFSGDENRRVSFQHPKQPRQAGYHPAQDCLQSSPLIFYDWGKGSLTIAARSLYYYCSNNSSSYIQQGADGVWPNLSWDLAESGQRTTVETVEYLYAPDTSQPLPQRYNNARFEALGDVSYRMGLQNDYPGVASNQVLGEMTVRGGPVQYAKDYIKRYENEGVDAFGAAFHDTWLSNPYIVDERYVLDPMYKENAELTAMCKLLIEAGYPVGYWYRPELVKTSIATVLSDTVPLLDGMYHTHGVGERQVPNPAPRMAEVGIKIIRENPQWIRLQRDGSWPTGTPYQWVPMSMASGWWDRIMWPTLVTSRAMGFTYVLQDGGFGGLSGVDYAPMLEGRTDKAVPCQPYWWRMFRSAHAVGVDLIGECTVGWKGGFVNLGGEADEHFLWMFQCGLMYDANELFKKPEVVHKIFQLYNAQRGFAGTPAIRKFAIDFYKKNPPPDWIEFVDLRQGEEIEVTVKTSESPVAGGPTRVTEDNQVTFKVRPWTWTDVIWHYNDGRKVVYPAYDKVNWPKE